MIKFAGFVPQTTYFFGGIALPRRSTPVVDDHLVQQNQDTLCLLLDNKKRIAT